MPRPCRHSPLAPGCLAYRRRPRAAAVRAGEGIHFTFNMDSEFLVVIKVCWLGASVDLGVTGVCRPERIEAFI